MINKIQFLKSAIVAGLATTQLSLESSATDQSHFKKSKKKWKHWIWINPNSNDKEEDLQTLYAYRGGFPNTGSS